MSWSQPPSSVASAATSPIGGSATASGWGRPPSPLAGAVPSSAAAASGPHAGFATQAANGWPSAPSVSTAPAAQGIRSTAALGYSSGGAPSNWGQPPVAQRPAIGGITRARSNSDLQKPSWDSVPGWSSSSTLGTSAGPSPSSGTPPASAAGGWGAQQPATGGGSSVGSWSSPPQQQRSEGVVGGWGSRVPTTSAVASPTADTASGWGRPANISPSAQQPQQQDNWGRRTPPSFLSSPADATPSSISGGGNWGRPPITPVQSAPDAGLGWNKPSAPTQNLGSWNAPNSSSWNSSQATPSPLAAQHGTASGWGPADPAIPVRVGPSSDWANSRLGAGSLAGQSSDQTGWASQRPGAEQATFSSDRLGFVGSGGAGFLGREDDLRKEVRKARSSVSFDRTGAPAPARQAVALPNNTLLIKPADGGKEREAGAAAASMRLFNRSFNEVNKSLGLAATEDVKLRRPSRSDRRGGGGVPEDNELSKAIGIYIYGISKSVRVQDILGVFSEFGDVQNVGVVTKQNREGRIYAYVDYDAPGSASRAIHALRGKLLFDLKEPLELRPHFDRKVPADDATASPRKKESTALDVKKEGKKPLAAGSTAKESNVATPVQSTERVPDETANRRTLHIANVPHQVDKSELEKLFMPFGDIRRIHVVQRPKERRAFAFISFKTEEAAAKALNAVKDGKHLGMSEPFKIEFSKAELHKEKEREKEASAQPKATAAVASTPVSGKAGAKERPTDKPWKKGADLAKLLEKSSAGPTKQAAPSSTPSTPKKSSGGRTTIYVREIADDVTAEALKTKFAAVGPVKSIFVVNKVGTGAGKCAVVAYEKGEDAAKAVKDKVENALFPRQRRLTIHGLPSTVQESDLKAYLSESGEVRRVDFTVAEAGENTEGQQSAAVEVEFARGDVAVVVFLRLLQSGYKGSVVSVGYSPSTAKSGESAADGADVSANGDDRSGAVGGGKDDGHDTGDEADREDNGRRGSHDSGDAEPDSASEPPASASATDAPTLATEAAAAAAAAEASEASAAYHEGASSSEDETDIEVVEVSMMDLNLGEAASAPAAADEVAPVAAGGDAAPSEGKE